MDVDVDFLASSEGIAACDTHAQLGTHASDGAGVEVGLDVEVPGLVEDAVEREVEGVSTRGEG